MIQGAIFDMDGVIIDTEKWYQRFWVQAANELGYPMKPCHVLQIRSLPGEIAAPLLQKIVCSDFNFAAVRSRRKELMAAHVAANGIEAKPGANCLLQYLKDNGIGVALATATDLERTKEYLSMIKLIDYFDEIVTADMVTKGKPQPDIYIEAARRLNLKPSVCIAAEDSPNGALAAYRAGCKTIMVPDLTPPDNDTKKILYAVADSLSVIIDIIEKENKGQVKSK